MSNINERTFYAEMRKALDATSNEKRRVFIDIIESFMNELLPNNFGAMASEGMDTAEMHLYAASQMGDWAYHQAVWNVHPKIQWFYRKGISSIKHARPNFG